MGILNDIESNLERRINRVNPKASIFSRPQDRKQDWLRTSLDRISQFAREKEEERRIEAERRQAAALRLKQRDDEQSKRAQQVGFEQERAVARQRFVDENAGKNVGSFSDRGAGRLAVARGNAQELRARGTFGAFTGVPDSSLKTWGQGYKEAEREALGALFDKEYAPRWGQERAARAFVLSGLAAEGQKDEPQWLRGAREYFEAIKGRGHSWEEFREYAKNDPAGALATVAMGIADSPDVPQDVFEAAIARWREQPDIDQPWRLGTKGPLGELTEKAVKAVTPDSGLSRALAGVAGGMVSSAERPIWGAASIPDALMGRPLDIDHWSGNDFQRRGINEALGLGLDSGVTWGSVGLGKLSGQTLLKGLARAGVKVPADGPLVRTLAGFAETFGANVALDVPATTASLKLQGASDEDVLKILPAIIAGDALAAGGVRASRQLGGRIGGHTGGELAGVAVSGGIGYTIAKAMGLDDRQALMAAALTGGGGGARALGGAAGKRRMGLTEEIPGGTPVFHGTRADFPIEEMRPSGGPTTSIGRGGYFFAENPSRPYIHPGEAAAKWVMENRQNRSEYGTPEGMAGAKVMLGETARPLKALAMDKPLTYEEFKSLSGATGLPAGALVNLDRWAQKGTMTGWDYLRAVREMFQTDPNFKGAGFDAQFSDKAGARAIAVGDAGDVVPRYNAFDREVALADAERYFAETQTRNGIPVGLPPGVRTPEDMAALRERIYMMAVQGREKRFWYERSGRGILGAFSGDVAEAVRFAQLVAIYSPRTGVDTNMNAALRAWSQWRAGQPVRVGTKAADRAAQTVLNGGQWNGRKTNTFYRNIIGYIDPEMAKRDGLLDGATIDRHMGTAYGFKASREGSVGITDAQYTFMENDIRAIAENLGWTTEQTQAAIWTTEKAIKNGLDISAAGFDYADALDNRVAQISWETMPGKTTGFMQELASAPLEVRMEWHHKISEALQDDAGRDIIAVKLGIPSPGDFDAPGVYVNTFGEVEFNPGRQTRAHAPAAVKSVAGQKIPGAEFRVDGAARELLNAYARMRGYFLKQEAVPWARPFPVKSLKDADAVDLRAGRGVSQAEVEHLARTLDPNMTAIIPTPNGIWLKDLTGQDHTAFVQAVEGAVTSMSSDTEWTATSLRLDGEYITNDWSTNPHGEVYIQGIRAAGFGDVFDELYEILEPRLRSITDEFRARYGWDAGGAGGVTRNTTGAAGAGGATGPLKGFVTDPNMNGLPTGEAGAMAAQMGAGVASGYLFPDEGEERGEAAAKRGAGAVLGLAITKSRVKTGRGGGLAVRSTQEADKLTRAMGAVPGAEVTPEVTPQELAKALRKTESQLKAESSARLKAHAQAKLDEVTQRRQEARAKPELVDQFADTSRQYMAEAEAAIGDPGTLRTIIKDIPGLGAVGRGVDAVADPAANFTTYHGRKVLAATVAAANYMRTRAGFQSVNVNEMLKALEPITGPEKHGRRALTQAATALGPAAAGEVAYQLTGDREYREAGILAGIGATAFASGYQKQTRWKNRGWEDIRLLNPEQQLPKGIQSGSGKLYDILQHPQRYDLSDAQLKAIKQYEVIRDGMMRDTNAALQAAGMEELITARDAHGILQWFEPDSVKLALGDHGRGAFRMETPGFDRLRAMQLHRDLGPTFEAALAAHPDLKPLRDPEALLSVEVKMHDQIRANAMLVRSLKDSGTGLRIPTEAEYKGMANDARAAYKLLVKDRELAGWQKLPGLDDYIFHPEAVKAVDTLLMPSRGRDTGPLAAADMVTNVLRQTMFTADMSAWTMQGAMLAINDPVGTVMNAKHLVGATVFGRKYFDKWVQENKALWTEYTRAGGVPGLEHGGLEKEGLTLSKLPFVGHLEQRGFEAFLPIHRALMYKHLKTEEAFISRLYKNDLGGAKRLASNALKNGPMALGLGAALAEFDVPGLDDDWEKVFLLALGFGGSVTGRKLVSAGAGDSTAAMRTQVAKQVNRSSGAFNRQMYGITAGQAQWERTIMARSPALLRNTIILANKAATDFGPEGAMARWYLVKTAALMGTALAAAEWAATGEMPSMNPADPDSLFNPKNAQFMRADADGAGRLAPSNPLLALVKAFMRTDPPDGVKRWRSQDWIPLMGLADWYQARQSDLFGPVASSAVRELGHAGQRKLGRAGIGSTGENARLYQEALFQLPVPVVLREMFEAGVIQQTETGKLIKPGTDALGLEADPAYNDVKERILGITGSFMGMNVTPESLSRELTRIKTEAVLKRFPHLTDRNGDGVIDYNDLNKEEQALIRGDTEGNAKYNAALQTIEERQQQDDTPDPVTNYFSAMEAANAKFEEQMKSIDEDYRAKRISAFQAKGFYQAAAENRRDELKYIEQLLGTQLAGKKGTTETVSQYLSRHLKPEDAAVEGYYDLYEQATGRDNKLNFDKLEALQKRYMQGLDPEARAYVERRISSFDKPQTTQFGMDYERAKALTQPYWDASEEAFAAVAGRGIFAGFGSYAEFEMAVSEYANENGVSPSMVLASFSGTREYRMFEKLLNRKRTLLVRANEDIGRALMEFYGKAPPQKTRSYREYQLFKRDSQRNARAGGLELFDLADMD